jgi:hypothetical protein
MDQLFSYKLFFIKQPFILLFSKLSYDFIITSEYSNAQYAIGILCYLGIGNIVNTCVGFLPNKYTEQNKQLEDKHIMTDNNKIDDIKLPEIMDDVTFNDSDLNTIYRSIDDTINYTCSVDKLTMDSYIQDIYMDIDTTNTKITLNQDIQIKDISSDIFISNFTGNIYVDNELICTMPKSKSDNSLELIADLETEFNILTPPIEFSPCKKNTWFFLW